MRIMYDFTFWGAHDRMATFTSPGRLSNSHDKARFWTSLQKLRSFHFPVTGYIGRLFVRKTSDRRKARPKTVIRGSLVDFVDFTHGTLTGFARLLRSHSITIPRATMKYRPNIGAFSMSAGDGLSEPDGCE